MSAPLQTLAQALAQLRLGLAARRPSPEQDAAVLRQLQRQLAARPQLALAGAGAVALAPRRWPLGAGALLLLLALALAWGLMRLPPPQARPQAPALQSAYLPLVSPQEWRAALGEQGGAVWLVPTELPRERLALLGLPYDLAAAASPVRAELMLDRRGQVLAVRFVE